MTIKITMQEEHVRKYFCILYDVENYDNFWQLFPKNKEIIPYLKYLKHFESSSNIFLHDTYYKLLREISLGIKNQKDFITYYNNNDHIYNGDEIIFEFPDDYPEEKLFYFKLKYC